jgi:CHAT domain-containing protein
VLADYSTDQIQMAATGRFDLLEKTLEDSLRSGPLTTRDQHALCYAYSKTKRYSRLMGCLDQLEVQVKKGDRRTRLFGLSDATPTVYIMRADALIELGQYPRAVDEANKAIAWLKEDGSDDLDLYFNALAGLSLAHALNGNEDAAWKAEKELVKLKTGLLSDFENAKANALARVRMGLKDYRGVIDAIRGDQMFAINVFLDRLVSGSFLTGVNNWVWAELPRAFMLNKALLEVGQINEARNGFDRLLGIKQVKENGEIYWLLLNDRGRIEEKEGHPEQALAFYRQAVDVIELQRANINTEASKIGFVGEKQMVYANVIDLAGKLKQTNLVFEYIERSKARALVDLLAARETGDPLKSSDQKTQQLLDNFSRAQADSAAQLPVDMSKVETTSSRMVASTQADLLRKQAPELASLLTVDAMRASEMLAYLRQDEVLIEFSGFGNTLYGIAFSGKESLSIRLDGKQIESDVRKFREEIQDSIGQGSPLAKSLYQQLIKPFEPLIGKRNLLIVPHGPLHYLPFAALHDGSDPLVGRRSLRYLPSVSVQKYIRSGKSKTLDNILILGNPDLGNKSLDLPSAEEEAKAIAALVPNNQILTRKVATETYFKKSAQNFNYLHIASHGQFKSDSALESRLLLASDAENDGSLTVSELYGIKLNADLVTLSACETGLGKVLSGDDLVGLTRGFLFAGASNIVASLWEVDDEATSALMKGFYISLKRGLSKKEALRQAQIETIKKYPQPMFWAAFYLTGDGI